MPATPKAPIRHLSYYLAPFAIAVATLPEGAYALSWQELDGHGLRSPPAAPNDASLIQFLRGQLANDPETDRLARWAFHYADDPPPVTPPWREFVTCHVNEETKACLPGFLLIGVQKSGTSTLYNILREHPQVRVSIEKELLWFSGNDLSVACNPPESAPSMASFAHGYLQNFPQLAPSDRATTAEFSATYFHCWCCPAAFQRLMPSVRLVVQLRDPIDRAKSRWTEQRAFGMPVPETFEEFIAQNLPPLKACLAKAANSTVEAARCAGTDDILGESLYADVFDNWFQHFDPSDFLVTYLEQLAVQPEAVLNAIHAHIGLDNFTYPKDLVYRTYNKEGQYGWDSIAYHRLRSPLEDLYDFYLPHMRRLKSLADKGSIAALPPSWVSRWGL